MDTDLQCTAGPAAEWGFTGESADAARAHDIEPNVSVTSPAAQRWKVPAFWCGGTEWRVRFRPPARLIDPRSGAETDLGDVNGDARGEWRVPCPPVSHDWLLVMEVPSTPATGA
jgi:hypothetical protein